MTTTSPRPHVLSQPGNGLGKLIVLLLSFFLLSCSSLSTKTVTPESPQKYLEDAAKARKNGPLEGDVRVIEGTEYVYGRNTKYTASSHESIYIWLPRDIYTPSLGDTFPGRVGSPTKKSKEFREIEERIARLEQALRGGGPPKTAPPEEPVKDETGKTWTRYFANDDGVEWFMDEDTLKRSGNRLELWRKKAFPRWAFQKEIVTLDEFNCREEQYRTRELRARLWDGSSQTSGNSTPWTYIYSNSPEHYLFNEYCR